MSEGRKYRISAIVSHQSLAQIPAKALSIILGNTATKISFRVSGENASTLAKTIYPQRAEDVAKILTNLPDGNAIVSMKAGFGEQPIPAFQIATFPPREKRFYNVDALIEKMKQKYMAPIVEAPVMEERMITPEVYDLLWIIRSLEEQGKEAIMSLALEEFRKEEKYKNMLGSQLSAIADIAQSLGLITREVVPRKGLPGRPAVVMKLTRKGLKKLGTGITMGPSLKGGGDLHRMMIMKLAEHLRKQGYHVEIEEQAGRRRQPNLVVYEKVVEDGKERLREMAVEVEVSAKHPEQIIKNLEKNLEMGREVVFVVPDEEIRERVKRALRDYAELTRVEVFRL
jgi:biotin operon repressor